MSSEIISLHIGNCGNQIGSSFFEYISEEHGLDPQGNYIGESFLQREKINNFFQTEVTNTKYSPRAILIDYDSTTIDSIRNSSQGKLFRSENMINMKNSANNIWSKAYYTDSLILMKKIQEQIRKEAELCDSLRGFQVISSISGGTGGGLLCKVVEELKDSYKSFISTVNILDFNPCLSVYNQILTLPSLIEKADQSIIINNESLYSLCEKTLSLEAASFADLNHLIAGALSILTGPMRFISPVSMDWGNLIMNMTPYEKMHFMGISLAPLAAKLTQQYKTLSGLEVFQQMNQEGNYLSEIVLEEEVILAIANVFRGHIGDKEAENLSNRYFEKNNDFKGKFKGTGGLMAHCSVPPKGVKLAGSCLVNSTCFQRDLKKIEGKFQGLFKKKSYLHWFLKEGMDDMEFYEKNNEVETLISDYEGILKEV